LFMIAAFSYGLSTETAFVSITVGVVIVICVVGGLIAYILRGRSGSLDQQAVPGD